MEPRRNEDLAFDELFADEDLDPTFDRACRSEPPWFGYVPRVLAVVAARPFHPTFALWRRGAVVEEGVFGCDRRIVAAVARALLTLTEDFADLVRARNLFGAHFVIADYGADAARAAVAAAVLREADWCGLFVAEPAPVVKNRGVSPAAALAAAYADALSRGEAQVEPLMARRRGLTSPPLTPLPDRPRYNGAPEAPAER